KGIQDRIGKSYWKIHEDYLNMFEITESKMIEVMNENCEKIENFLKKYRSYSSYKGYNLKILKLLELRRRYQRLSRELETEAHFRLRELQEYEYELRMISLMLQASQRELQEFEDVLVEELEKRDTELKKYHMT
ncbi:3531_t:CDS:2, partial [Acaulospora colombiana]